MGVNLINVDRLAGENPVEIQPGQKIQTDLNPPFSDQNASSVGEIECAPAYFELASGCGCP